MSDPKIPSVLKSLHPQTLGKNKFANPPQKKEGATVSAQSVTPNTPTVAVASAPPPSPATAHASTRAPVPVAPSPAPKSVVPKSEKAQPEPGKDKSYFELTIKLVGSDEPPFVVETVLTGNGAADKAKATAVARKRYPGKSMTILNSRIYTKTEGALTEISPGSTLSSLFGATGEVAEDLVEVGKAFHDGSRGTLFLRNLRSHIGLAFRPATGGLIVYSNRVASNRLASELPMIVSEILGNGAREIQIYLK